MATNVILKSALALVVSERGKRSRTRGLVMPGWICGTAATCSQPGVWCRRGS